MKQKSDSAPPLAPYTAVLWDHHAGLITRPEANAVAAWLQAQHADTVVGMFYTNHRGPGAGFEVGGALVNPASDAGVLTALAVGYLAGLRAERPRPVKPGQPPEIVIGTGLDAPRARALAAHLNTWLRAYAGDATGFSARPLAPKSAIWICVAKAHSDAASRWLREVANAFILGWAANRPGEIGP